MRLPYRAARIQAWAILVILALFLVAKLANGGFSPLEMAVWVALAGFEVWYLWRTRRYRRG